MYITIYIIKYVCNKYINNNKIFVINNILLFINNIKDVKIFNF